MKYECAICILVIQCTLCKADELDLLFAENENYEDNANYEDFDFDFEDYDYDFLNVKKSTCKHPGPIKHGKVEIWGDDLLLDYTCDKGFIPHGITHGACDVKNKAWTIDPVVCVSSDCTFLLPPRKGIVSMHENQAVASITCEQGLHLIGSPVLYCQQGKWVGDFPVCARSSELENHSGLNVTEEERLHKKFVEQSDESCFHYHIEPPKILYSLVITSYIMNTKRKRYVMVARYSCVNGYRLLNGNAAYLYCKNSKWTAEIMPKCILDNDPCEVNNGGCDHNCVFYSKTNKYICTCKVGYTLGSDKKQCVDIDECLVENAGCQQLCINTHGSYTCSCNRGYITNGTQCTGIVLRDERYSVKMLVEERELISKLLRQSILTLCRETMSQYKLEVDGIVCISFENDSHPIIIKVHEQLQTDSGGSTLWALNNNKNDSLVTYNPYDVSGKKSSELKERLLNDSPRPRDFSVTDDDLDDNSFNDSSYSYKNFMKLGFLAATRGRLNSSLNDKKSKSNPLDSSLASSPDEYKSMSPPLGGVKCEDDDESAFQIPDDDSPFSTLPLPDVMPEAIPTVSRPGIPNTIHAQSAALTHPDGYVCRRCFQVLPDTSAFESHNLRVHTLFTCKICFRAFTARNNLKRHIRLHTGVKPYKCPICNQGFTRKDDLKGHELRHSFKKPFRCNICKKGYTDRSCVRNHMAKEHNMKLQHVCPRCGEGFSSSEKFTEHKKTHPEFKNYRCETCDFIGVNGLMHIKHQLTHEDKKYSCKPCNNTYDDPFKYSEHLKIHRVDESFKSYECCFCGSCQQTYDQFVRHEHSHAQFKNNTCTICSKSFMYPSSLKDHMATHNRAEEDESSDYYCNECQTGFPTLDSLEEHIVSTHESVDQMMDDSPYDDTVNDSLSTSRQDSIEEAEQRTEHPPPEPDEPESDLNILKNSYITLQKPPSIIPMKNRSQGRTKSSKSPMGRFSPLSLKSALSSTEKHSPSTKTPDAFASMILAPFPQDFSLEESMKTYASADDSNPGVNNGSLPDRNPSIKLEPGSYENGSEDPSIISGHTNEGGDASDNRDMMVLEKVQIRPPGFERVFTPSLLFKCHSSFQCIECSKVFTDFNQFETHSAILHRRFLCEFCGKVFTAKPNRDRHLRYHTGERPYKCGLCDASFFRGDDLKYHRTTKHASEKPFVCDVCGLNFAWPKDLQRHRKQKKHFKI